MGCLPCEEKRRRLAEKKANQEGKNYTIVDVIKDEISGQAEYVDNDTYWSRLRICRKCPHFIPIIEMCGECSCLLKLKAKYKESQCPDNPDCKLGDKCDKHEPRWLAVK